jgi:hypothetical protein
MTAHTQNTDISHQSPRTGSSWKLLSSQNKLGRVKTSPEKSRARIKPDKNRVPAEWQNNG